MINFFLNTEKYNSNQIPKKKKKKNKNENKFIVTYTVLTDSNAEKNENFSNEGH